MNTKNLIRHTAIALALSLGLGSAGAQQGNMPPEVQERLLKLLLQAQQQNGGAALQQPYAQQAQPPAAPRISEAALAQQMAAWPAQPGPFVMERFRDGFSVNGQRVLDPEGRIGQYALDGATGDISYTIEVAPNQFQIKLMRQGGQPLVIGTASRLGGQWQVETVTGVRVAGSRMTLSGRGLIVARDNALFRYEAGRGLLSSALPETHTMAALQNGDIGATGWVLLEKRQDTKAQEGGALANTSLGALFGAVKALGAAVGVNKSDSDYALFELQTGKLLPVGISLDEKQAQVLSQCHRRNAVVNICDRMDSVESIWAQGGGANRGHYFWRISWYLSLIHI